MTTVRDQAAAPPSGPEPIEPFPWASLLGLVYVLWGTWSASQTPLPALGVAGAAVTNMGYVVIGGGVLAGSFRILGLRGRGRTILAGIGMFVLGVVLANMAIHGS